MHRLTAVILTFLVLFTSVLPLASARQTNAEQFRRGKPPLPPSRLRRDGAHRPEPSPKPPVTASGYIIIRNTDNDKKLGYMQNFGTRGPLIGVTPPDSPKSTRLRGTYSGSEHTLEVTNALFPPPFFLGSTFPFADFPDLEPPEEILFTNIDDIPGARVWTFDKHTRELTSKSISYTISPVNLPKPEGGSVPAVFAWDTLQNALELVTDVPTFLAATKISEPADQQPILVRIFLGQGNDD